MFDRYVVTADTSEKFYIRANSIEDARGELAEYVTIADVVKLPVTTKKAEVGTLIKVYAEEWFDRPDFMAWLRGKTCSLRQATWHPAEEEKVTDYSDVFVTVDLGYPLMSTGDGCGSDMPSDIWDELCQVVEAAGVQECVVWISPLSSD